MFPVVVIKVLGCFIRKARPAGLPYWLCGAPKRIVAQLFDARRAELGRFAFMMPRVRVQRAVGKTRDGFDQMASLTFYRF